MQWLVEIDPPLFTYDHHDEFLDAQKLEDEEERHKRIVDILSHLPIGNRVCLFALFKLLSEIHKNAETTKMPSSSIAIIMAPTVMRSRPGECKDVLQQLTREAECLRTSIGLVEHIVLNYDLITQKVDEKLNTSIQLNTSSGKTSNNSNKDSYRSPRGFSNLLRKNSGSNTKERKLLADDPDRVINSEDATCISSVEAVLADPVMSESFMRYLREKELSDENLLFFYEAEKFKALPNEKRLKVLKDIWKEYVFEEAPRQINIDTEVRGNMLRAIESFDESDPADLGNVLNDAQAFVYNLIHEHSYPRFLQSPQCRSELKKIEESSKKKK